MRSNILEWDYAKQLVYLDAHVSLQTVGVSMTAARAGVNAVLLRKVVAPEILRRFAPTA
jgi:hypothetical protein